MELYNVLLRSMGPSGWWPADTSFEVCIGAILTQNAPWSGVVRAIGNLKESGMFGVGAIAHADERTLAEAIRPAVYYNQKAKKLKAFCRFLLDRYKGGIEKMAALDPTRARRELLSVPGIGYETADSILLYALGMPVFVVDAYTKRILTRHHIVPEDCGYEELREFFEDRLEPDPVFFNEFHAQLCRLGAEYCRKRPRCGDCPARTVLGEPES
jgi:endonuclease-3 related protein